MDDFVSKLVSKYRSVLAAEPPEPDEHGGLTPVEVLQVVAKKWNAWADEREAYYRILAAHLVRRELEND